MDATGLVRAYYDYDALGNVIRIGTTNEVKYQFTGQEYDESGVHNYRARLYDSDLGKFYAVDPEGEFVGSFLYAGNNPISYTDPTGEFINLVAFAYYAYQAYQYASYAFTAYSLFQGYRQGGIGGLIQAGVSIGASTVISGSIGNVIGGKGLSLGSSVLAGGLGSAGGSIAGAYASGQNPFAGSGFSSLGFSGGLGSVLGGLRYAAYDYNFYKKTGYHLSQKVPTKELDNFANTPELSAKRQQAGNPDMVVAGPNNVPEGYSYNKTTRLMDKLDPDDGRTVIKSDIGGHTSRISEGVRLPNGSYSYKTKIFMAPRAFDKAVLLYFTLGHELTHGIHYYTGLMSLWGDGLRSEYEVMTTWDIPFLKNYTWADPLFEHQLKYSIEWRDWYNKTFGSPR